jgi:hypothetical protein
LKCCDASATTVGEHPCARGESTVSYTPVSAEIKELT